MLKLRVEFKPTDDLNMFFAKRKQFDEQLIRLAIKYSITPNLKNEISKYIDEEHKYCQFLVTLIDFCYCMIRKEECIR